jgi:hypothetical protein
LWVADLVVCDGDPLANISLLGEPNNVLLVMQNGRIVKEPLPALGRWFGLDRTGERKLMAEQVSVPASAADQPAGRASRRHRRRDGVGHRHPARHCRARHDPHQRAIDRVTIKS